MLHRRTEFALTALLNWKTNSRRGDLLPKKPSKEGDIAPFSNSFTSHRWTCEPFHKSSVDLRWQIFPADTPASRLVGKPFRCTSELRFAVAAVFSEIDNQENFKIDLIDKQKFFS